jgi:hypothetical protein
VQVGLGHVKDLPHEAIGQVAIGAGGPARGQRHGGESLGDRGAARGVGVLQHGDGGGPHGGRVGGLRAGRIDPRADGVASKMASSGTMSVPGSVATVRRGFRSETGTAKASWGGVNDGHLVFDHLGDRQRPLVGAVRQQAEDAAGPWNPAEAVRSAPPTRPVAATVSATARTPS